MLWFISLKSDTATGNFGRACSHLFTISLIPLVLQLAGCTSSGGALLNSERIAREFGSYGVDVLQADQDRRISSLYSQDGESRITRTYAVVDFATNRHQSLEREHAIINAGGSIGATFKGAGWQVDKQHIYIGEIEVPAEYAEISRLMQVRLPDHLAVHVYLLVVSDDEDTFRYATITEVHHPDYLTATTLREIYGEIIFDDSNRDGLHDFIGPPNAVK